MRRLAAWALATALSASPALAQNVADRIWQSADQWFQADFPVPPRITPARYDAPAPGGQTITLPATRYAATAGSAQFEVIVTHLTGKAAQGDVVGRAIIRQRRTTRLALDASTSHSYGASGLQACGRQFGYLGKDGRLNYKTVFYNERTGLLYDVRSSVAADDQADHGADVSHFQQSFALLPEPGAKPPPDPDYPATWQATPGPEEKFTIRFPTSPTVEHPQWQGTTGPRIGATTYQVSSAGTLYRVTSVPLWQSEADVPGVLDHEIDRWRHRGAVLNDAAIAINAGQCGRDITYRDRDGTRGRVWLFFPSSQHWLYIIETRRKGPFSAPAALNERRFLASFTLAKPEDKPVSASQQD